MKKIIITGPLGQDGIILTELLHNNYELYGICKVGYPSELISEHKKKYKINLLTSDLTKKDCVDNLIKTIKPNIIINFAGETNVINPWSNPINTFEQNFFIPSNILNSILKFDETIFFFQSSSSLMYAKSLNKIINEKSKFSPMFPYGISKLSAHILLNEYRNNFKINCSSGIFFNHESFYRNKNFISKKISTLVGQIIKGEKKTIKLYDLNFNRDISHAKDFMNGVKLIIENNINDDFIFSSGVSTNVFDFSKKFFTLHNLNFYDYVDYSDSNNYDNDYNIIGNNKKLKSIGWKPEYTIDNIITEMVNKELKL